MAWLIHLKFSTWHVKWVVLSLSHIGSNLIPYASLVLLFWNFMSYLTYFWIAELVSKLWNFNHRNLLEIKSSFKIKKQEKKRKTISKYFETFFADSMVINFRRLVIINLSWFFLLLRKENDIMPNGTISGYIFVFLLRNYKFQFYTFTSYC